MSNWRISWISMTCAAILFIHETDESKVPCKWFVNKITPGPVGTDIKNEYGARKMKEYIEIATACSEATYKHVQVIVVQSLVVAGMDIDYPTPMPTIISSYNVGSLKSSPNPVVKTGPGKLKTILIGRDFDDNLGNSYSAPSWHERSRSCTCIYNNKKKEAVLEKNDQKFPFHPILSLFDTSKVIYSVHVLNNQWKPFIVDDVKYERKVSLDYSEYQEKRRNEFRRVDSVLAEVIRTNQMDAVLYAPSSKKWNAEDPYAKTFISEYTKAMFESLDGDEFDLRPRVVWYDPKNENPLVFCGPFEEGFTSFHYQQVDILPGEDNENFCCGENVPFTDLQVTWINKKGRSQLKEKGKVFDTDLDAETEVGNSKDSDAETPTAYEQCERSKSQDELSVNSIDYIYEKVDGERKMIYSVPDDVCEANCDEFIDIDVDSTGTNEVQTTLIPPPNRVIIKLDYVKALANVNAEMSDWFIDALMELIIFDEKSGAGAYQQSAQTSLAFLSSNPVPSDCIIEWSQTTPLLVFAMQPVRFFKCPRPDHFSAVVCVRETQICSIYDSLSTYISCYDERALLKIAEVVNMWDCSTKYTVVLAKSSDVARQADGFSCALFAVYHMSKALGFEYIQEGIPVTGLNLRKATADFLEVKKDFIHFQDFIYEKPTFLPKLMERHTFRNTYSSGAEVGLMDSPNEADILRDSQVKSDKAGIPYGRTTKKEKDVLKNRSIKEYLKSPEPACVDGDEHQNSQELTDAESLEFLKGQPPTAHSFMQKFNFIYTTIESLNDIISAHKTHDSVKIEQSMKVAAEIARGQGLEADLKRISKELNFAVQPKNFARYVSWFRVHVGTSLESSYFFCRICNLEDDSLSQYYVKDRLSLEDIILPRQKRDNTGESRKRKPNEKYEDFEPVLKKGSTQRKTTLVGRLHRRVYLSDLCRMKDGRLEKDYAKWNRFTLHVRRHESVNEHKSNVIMNEVNLKEMERREQLAYSQLQVTCNHFRTVVSMVKFNIPLMHFTSVLKMQLLNGANIGINLYKRQHARDILVSVAEKLKINLIMAMYQSNKPFSLLADASTSKDAHQYLVLSVKCTLDSVHYQTFFYSIVEISKETGKVLMSTIEKVIREDSLLLKQSGHMETEEKYENWFWKKIIGFASDGGPSFAGDKEGLQGQLLTKLGNRPFFYSVCMAHRLDLVTKQVNTEFRSFLTFLYSVTYRYFGSAQNKMLVDHYRGMATAADLIAPNIKTIYKVRWVASELAALNNLLKGWKSILRYLQHRCKNVPVKDKSEIPRARMLAILRFVMEDARVFRAAVTWKLILEKFTAASKHAQREGATIASVWPLLHTVEQNLYRNRAWILSELDLLHEYGLQRETGRDFRRIDDLLEFFGKGALPVQMRFDSSASNEFRPKISISTRATVLRGVLGLDEPEEEPTEQEDTLLLDKYKYTYLRKSTDYEIDLKELLDYVLIDTKVIPPPPKKESVGKKNPASGSISKTATTAGTTVKPRELLSTRLRAHQYNTMRTSDQALKDSEDPEALDPTTKVPAFLSYYLAINWEKFSLDGIVEEVRENVRERIDKDENSGKFDYLQFEALSERFITDTIDEGHENVFSHSLWTTKFIPDNWFGNDDQKRKTAHSDSLTILQETFQLGDDFKTHSG